MNALTPRQTGSLRLLARAAALSVIPPAPGQRAELRPDYWQTQDGRIYKISDMPTSHLMNLRAYLVRRTPYYRQRLINRDIAATLSQLMAAVALPKDTPSNWDIDESTQWQRARETEILRAAVPQYDNIVAEIERRTEYAL